MLPESFSPLLGALNQVGIPAELMESKTGELFVEVPTVGGVQVIWITPTEDTDDRWTAAQLEEPYGKEVAKLTWRSAIPDVVRVVSKALGRPQKQACACTETTSCLLHFDLDSHILGFNEEQFWRAISGQEPNE